MRWGLLDSCHTMNHAMGASRGPGGPTPSDVAFDIQPQSMAWQGLGPPPLATPSLILEHYYTWEGVDYP